MTYDQGRSDTHAVPVDGPLRTRLRSERSALPDEGRCTPKTRRESCSHRPLEPLRVPEFQSGKRDDLLELLVLSLYPSKHGDRLLFRTVTHVERGASQHRHPQNLFGAFRLRVRRETSVIASQG